MEPRDLTGCLAFLNKAENLKNTFRSARTSAGRVESTAEHTWRLCLMLITFEREFTGYDMTRLLKMAILHDLAEAVCGDVPAVEQTPADGKSQREKAAMDALLADVPPDVREGFLELWLEYETGETPESRLVKGLDKLETIIQHNQGDNPRDFDYAFNLDYGRQYMDAHPLLRQIRAIADAGTRLRDRSSERNSLESGMQ